ncbi:MAG: hypothetical protein WCP39_06620 [Chlamydiota bacterium]
MSSRPEDFLLLIKDTKTFLEYQEDSFLLGFPSSSPVNLPPIQMKPTEKAPIPPKQNTYCAPKPTITNEDSLQDIQKAFSEIAPGVSISLQIPEDKEAKWISQKWKLQNMDIAILTNEDPQSTTKSFLFLQNLTKALSFQKESKLFFAKELEKNGEWNSFLALPWKKILIEEKALHSLSNLLTHLKYYPSNRTSFLENIPLFLLEDLSIYLKNPEKKKELWLNLLQQLSFNE